MGKETTAALLIAAAFLSGCNGWPRTAPYVEAAQRPEKYVTYLPAPARSAETFAIGERRYMVLPVSIEVRNTPLRQIGSAQSGGIFALQAEDAPYGTVFVRGPHGGWRMAAPID